MNFKHLFAVVSILAIAACNPQGELETGHIALAENNIGFGVPSVLKSVRAVNPVNLRSEVLVGGKSISMTRAGNDWQGSISLMEGTHSLSISWFEDIGGGVEVKLAELNQDIVMEASNTTVTLTAEMYNTGFDNDGDGFSNLDERRQNSDPNDAGSPRTDGVNVTVPFIATSDAPTIDGLYDAIWNNSQFNDVTGNQLSINNLLVGSDPARSDGNTEYQWAALHDEINLYIMVFFDNVETTTLFADSAEAFNDDNVTLYWDGSNNSKTVGSSYDGVDDYIVRIPLLVNATDVNTSTHPNSRLEIGAGSVAAPAGLEFAACRCINGRNLWEIKIPLATSGIQSRRALGFDVQIDDDIDGGTRDAKWAWFHPSRTDADVDDAEQTPSALGTMLLE